MAIQFPNFLAAQTARPDYSGLGDIVNNYYAGKAMPKDDLIKAIQAEFARPTAEASLQSTRLSNQKMQQEIQKAAMEMAQQKEFERQLKQAFMNNIQQPSAGSPSMMGGGMPQAKTPTPAMPPMTMRNNPADMLNNISPNLGAVLSQNASPMPNMTPIPAAPSTAETAPIASASIAPSAPLQMPEEQVITRGSPHLAGIDLMWENNPLSREFLKKKGYEKKEQIKFDNKTGKTSIITHYPSGTISVRTLGGASGEEGIPLTNKMISKHQNIVSSIDNALPIIKQIEDLNEKTKNVKGEEIDKYWEPYPRSSGLIPGLGWVPGFQSQSVKYEALVNSALDSLVGAYGLPSTNEGIETVKKQLLIGHGETDKAYIKRLKDLVEDLKRRRSYSLNEVKKSNKIQPVSRSGVDISDLDQFDTGGGI